MSKISVIFVYGLAWSTLKAATAEFCMDPTITFFSVAAKSLTFIDKSLLIKELVTNGGGVVTAPNGFGKSTNLDMVKRFLEITVDENGNLPDINTTENYKLFTENKVKISEDKTFFNEHFGKHPVLYIDYSDLSGADSFIDFFPMLRNIFMKAFKQHMYLLNSTDFYTKKDAKWLFKMYNSTKKYNREPIHTVWDTPKKLVKLLHDHFQKKVFVLIDDYNTLPGELHSAQNADKKRVDHILEEINRSLLRKNEFLQSALVTGVPLERWKIGLKTKYLNKYKFLRKHPFSEYFGITKTELEFALRKLVKPEKWETVRIEMNEKREQLQKSLLDAKNIKDISNITIYGFIPFLNSTSQNQL